MGSGARAIGMGGAFIAVADDATAASWNPGGLTQLEAPELSFVWSWKFSTEEFDSYSHPELAGEFDDYISELNYLSLVYPFPRSFAGRNLVVSLNLQKRHNFDYELDYVLRDFVGLSTGSVLDLQHRVKYDQKGSLSALSPAVGFELTNRLSLGVAANIWDSSIIESNHWENTTKFRTRSRIDGAGLAFTAGQFEEKYEDIRGTNYTFGLLYRATERLSLGAVYNTKFAADVRWTQVNRIKGQSTSISREKRRMEFPSSFGVGAAYRFPKDKLTVSADVTQRAWDEFVEVEESGRRTSPITGLTKAQSSHDPTYTVRIGGECVFVDQSRPVQKYLPSLRAGFFYDEVPAGNQPDLVSTRNGLGRVTGKVDQYYGFTIGAGVLVKNRVNIDAAYQYRWGNDVRKDTFQLHSTDAGVDQHEFYLSTVLYFG